MKAAGVLICSRRTRRSLFGLRSSLVGPYPLFWGSWGGKMEPGESPLDAASRELAEETGYRGPVELQKLPTYSAIGRSTFHNFLGLVEDEFEPRLQWETAEAEWRHLRWRGEDGIPTPLHPGLAWLLEQAETREALLALGVRL